MGTAIRTLECTESGVTSLCCLFPLSIYSIPALRFCFCGPLKLLQLCFPSFLSFVVVLDSFSFSPFGSQCMLFHSPFFGVNARLRMVRVSDPVCINIVSWLIKRWWVIVAPCRISLLYAQGCLMCLLIVEECWLCTFRVK